MIRIFLGFAAALAIAGIAGPALAAFDSAYTDINLDECSITESSDFGSVWACAGYKGTPVRIAEGDLRFFVSYGFGAADEPAAGQTPPPFNTLGPKIEWRMSNASGAWKPVATIVRYFVSKDDGASEGQILVVTQLGEGQTCQIAYVDALANSNANELARKAADDLAGSYDCTAEPELVGKFEAWLP
jgi:hypothetical protein